MPHVRKQIRDRVKALVTGLTTTGSRVYASRIYPLQNDNLPGLCIFTENEEIDDEEGKVERLQHRYLNVVVTGHAKVTSGLDDDLDTIAEEVETAVFADRFLNGLAMALDLISIETGFSADAEKPSGEIEIKFRVQYFTAEGAPGTAI